MAAEAGVSRGCLSKLKDRYDRLGEAGLHDRIGPASRTARRPKSRRTWVERIEQLRREHKCLERGQGRQWARTRGAKAVYVYLHSVIDGYSRPVSTERTCLT